MGLFRKESVEGQRSKWVEIPYQGQQVPASSKPIEDWHIFLKAKRSKVFHSGGVVENDSGKALMFTICNKDLKDYEVVAEYRGEIAKELSDAPLFDGSKEAWLRRHHPDLEPCKYCFMLY